MSWLESSGVEAKWKKVKDSASEAGVMAEDFADAAVAIISVFDLLKGMGMAKSDMMGNANTVKGLSAGTGKTLQQLVDADHEGKDAAAVKKITSSGKPPGTRALLWLVRASLFSHILTQMHTGSADCAWLRAPCRCAPSCVCHNQRCVPSTSSSSPFI